MIEASRIGDLKPTVLRGTERTVIAVIGDERAMASIGGSRAGRASTKCCRSSPRTKSPAARRSRSRPSSRPAASPWAAATWASSPGRARVESEEQIIALGPRDQEGRRDGAPRRRVQAADQPLQLPGHEGRRPQAAGQGPRGNGPGGRHRSRRQRRRVDWSPNTPTCCRSAPATCRTTACSKRSASRRGRCCSSAARARRWTNSCSRPSTSSTAAISR